MTMKTTKKLTAISVNQAANLFTDLSNEDLRKYRLTYQKVFSDFCKMYPTSNNSEVNAKVDNMREIAEENAEAAAWGSLGYCIN